MTDYDPTTELRDEDKSFLRGCIDRSYQKGKGTKVEQVDAILAAVTDAVNQMKQYRPMVPIAGGGLWAIEFACGHAEQIETENIRENAIWPYCNRCDSIQMITAAGPQDEVFGRLLGESQ